MIKRFFKIILLKDIIKSLKVGLKFIFKKPVTKKISNIKRVDNFRRYFSIDPKKCVACRICVGICPCNAIEIITKKEYKFNKEICSYCRLCEKSCPKKAIKFSSKFITKK